MKKILTIVGARPQFVKAAAVSRILRKRHEAKEILVHTGQHFDKNMSDVFFSEMEIPKPDFHLDINSLNHGAMTGRMIERLEELMLSEKPDMVLIYGDTNSTLAGAISASKLHIPIAHVEAGLRSFNMRMPEEINRILADRVSSLLFCPTDVARINLIREGYENFGSKMVVSGDVMYDAALFYAARAQEFSVIRKELNLGEYALCTLHRAENTDNVDNLKSICEALNIINDKIPIVLPLHPRTRKLIQNLGINLRAKVLDPVGYYDMISLLDGAGIVLTDSGGLQKEAYFFKKPCVTMRDQTEWIELIEEGVNVLTGANGDKIIAEVENMMGRNHSFGKELYGNGHSAELIVDEILQY